MADFNLKQVVTGESTQTVNFVISPCPDAVAAELQKGLAKVPHAKNIGQIQDGLIAALKALKNKHPGNGKKTARILLVVNNATLIDKDMPL
jgi:hypothetical protein